MRPTDPPMRAALGFIAGAIAVLVFHQGAWTILYLAGLMPPPYPMGGYSVPVMRPLPMASNQGNTFGLLSMIFGIVSIPLLCCLYIGVPIGIAALVLGIIGLNKANRGEADNKGMAIAGVVCGGIGVLLGLLWIVAVFGFNASSPSHYY